ncbi:MAG: hypothetical protein KBF66_02985 [Rhodoferax sp.]|uniref:hypothetical protein n=1 Tax=Rhodoferax sp. TaxID=50421 RepID=UPI001B497A49|nr:hypothetical protein [Rhodoferax sp.]MBP9904496.1 hypothetical protein [Rhodoferax sp.]
MELKNLFSGATLTLPDDLLWSDEHDWTPVVSSVSYLMTGALLVQSATRQAGRAITLVGAADMAWVTRATLEKLRLWAGVALDPPSGSFTLTFKDARTFTVAFDHASGPIEAAPVLGYPSGHDGDFYHLLLRFLEI